MLASRASAKDVHRGVAGRGGPGREAAFVDFSVFRQGGGGAGERLVSAAEPELGGHCHFPLIVKATYEYKLLPAWALHS